ncbi:MAG: ribonuclease P protein component [Planctomycetales bacterium]|nr:ribonuclease P protein component [Planctomycetales bacterium]
MRFPKSSRLLRSAEFDAVFAAKCSAADGWLIVYGLPNDLERPRLGLVVSRKVGKAVVRNRWKRVLREAFRLSQHELPPLDLVCLPRSRDTPALEPIATSLRGLVARVQRKAHNRSGQEAPRDS